MTRGYEGVKRWTKQVSCAWDGNHVIFSENVWFHPMFSAQVDLFSKSLLLVPIHLEVHWCLVTADFIRKRICLYDSQGNVLQKVARVDIVFCVHISVYFSCFFCKLPQLLISFFLFTLPMTEHPEILDDRSKGEAANSFWEWLDGIIWWGILSLMLHPEMINTVFYRYSQHSWWTRYCEVIIINVCKTVPWFCYSSWYFIFSVVFYFIKWGHRLLSVVTVHWLSLSSLHVWA